MGGYLFVFEKWHHLQFAVIIDELGSLVNFMDGVSSFDSGDLP